jgi:small subunit ribosomal protein S6
MQAYECVYILTPDLEEKAVEEFSEQVGELISSGDGEVTKVDIWGKRKLAYEIQGMSEGIYTVLCFKGSEKILDDMNKKFKFDNKVLRHMVVVDEKPPENEKTGSSKSDIK